MAEISVVASDLALDSEDRVILAEGPVVRRLDPVSGVVTVLAVGPGVDRPAGAIRLARRAITLAFDTSNRLHVGLSNGDVVRLEGGDAVAVGSVPDVDDLAIAPDGSIFATSSQPPTDPRSALYRIDALTGETTVSVPHSSASPQAVTTGADGCIYFTDANGIWALDPATGEYMRPIDSPVDGCSWFRSAPWAEGNPVESPNAIAALPDGDLVTFGAPAPGLRTLVRSGPSTAAYSEGIATGLDAASQTTPGLDVASNGSVWTAYADQGSGSGHLIRIDAGEVMEISQVNPNRWPGDGQPAVDHWQLTDPIPVGDYVFARTGTAWPPRPVLITPDRAVIPATVSSSTKVLEGPGPTAAIGIQSDGDDLVILRVDLLSGVEVVLATVPGALVDADIESLGAGVDELSNSLNFRAATGTASEWRRVDLESGAIEPIVAGGDVEDTVPYIADGAPVELRFDGTELLLDRWSGSSWERVQTCSPLVENPLSVSGDGRGGVVVVPGGSRELCLATTTGSIGYTVDLGWDDPSSYLSSARTGADGSVWLGAVRLPTGQFNDPDDRVASVHVVDPPRPQSTITLRVATSPAGDSAQFTLSGGLSGALAHGQAVSGTVAPGSTSVTVSGPTGWAPSGVSCDDDDSGAGESAEEVVFRTLDAEQVSCVILMAQTQADLSLTKTVDQSTVVAGGTLRYTLQAHNHGPGVATDVELTDILPAGISFVAADGCARDGEPPSEVVRCSVGSLPAGESATRTIEALAGPPGVVVNFAAVSSSSVDPDPTDDTTGPVSSSVVSPQLNPCQAGPGNEVWALGRNALGALGSLVPGSTSAPLPVNLLRGVRSLDSDGAVSVAALDNRSVCSWGLAWTGGLGRPRGADIIGWTFEHDPVPAPVLTSGNIPLRADRVVANVSGGLAIDDVDGDGAGSLYGWGNNERGQVRPGTPGGRVERAIAIPLPGGRQVIDVQSSYARVLAVTEDRRVWVWGDDRGDQLGPIPGNQTGLAATDLTPYLPLDPGEQPARVLDLTQRVVVVTDRGRGLCWSTNRTDATCGGDVFSEVFQAPGQILRVDGRGNTVAMVVDDGDGDSAGDVHVWGANPGDGSTVPLIVPGLRQAALPEEVAAVSASETHVLALGRSGTVWGWGNPTGGALALGVSATKVLFPTPLPFVSADLIEAGQAASFVRAQPTGAAARYESTTLNLERSTTGTTDSEGDGATQSDRIETTITNSSTYPGALGRYSAIVTEGPLDPLVGAAPRGYQVLGEMASISGESAASPAPSADPFVVRFSLYLSPVQRAAQEAFGDFVQKLKVFRNGVEVPDCSSTAAPHPEDPCVRSRGLEVATGNAVLTVATTRFSTWTFAAPAPVVDAGGPYTAVEGSSVLLDGDVSGVPDGAVSVTWSGSDDVVDLESVDTELVAVDDGTLALSLSASAADQSGSDSTELTIENADPVIDDVTVSDAGPGSALRQISVEFSDPGVVDHHEVTVDWGDGSLPTSGSVREFGGGTFTSAHTYPSAGSYSATVTVEDDDGGSDSAVVPLTVDGLPLLTVEVASHTGVVRGAQVRLWSVGGPGPVRMRPTAVNGIVAFLGVEPGDYLIEVRSPTGRLRGGWFGGPTRRGAEVVTIGDTDRSIRVDLGGRT